MASAEGSVIFTVSMTGGECHGHTFSCPKQICEAFSANRYPFPEEPTRQRQMNAEVTARLRELQTTIEAGECCLSSSQCPNACFTVPVPLYPE